ncbi:MAG TPA: acyl-CoA dehydrogenase [Xanthobacteraceae bacterium]|jgi:acyl-CoA dehydrogenase|nr:acyl-CoA dehydrogenase [Xanthobacteraceae bacterium]
MTYQAPVSDIAFSLKHAAGFMQALAGGLYGDLAEDDVDAILEEAGRVASEVLAPLNVLGDREGVHFENGRVTMPAGWKDAYETWASAGWNGLSAPEVFGGQALPQALNAACTEMWNAASMAFGVGPVLTSGAIEALMVHGSEALQKAYLPKLVSGEWTGTMQLTEPQAGSDLALLRTRAERAGDETYRIKGQKIFITYGEHDLTDNIVHLVLARLPDAPAGTRGISLFLVPKFLLKDDGTPGERNDVRAHAIEHKLGIHGSPTCTMILGDHGGAVGYLIGEENRGLACMFTMMNLARLSVGLQGVAIAERATQQALAYARERKQGSLPGESRPAPIIAHPDVKRMLMTMRAQTRAARALCYTTAVAIDHAHRKSGEDARKAHELASLLTPVAKAYSTDIGCDVASLGVQVHGGMGYIEETGAAQHFRDARIAPIYEGTNGIQAIDLVMRKLPQSDGAILDDLIARLRTTIGHVNAANDPAFGTTAKRLAEAVDALERTSAWMMARIESAPQEALASATPYLRLFGHAVGGCLLADEALAARRLDNGDDAGRTAIARFFAEAIASAAPGLETTVVESADSITAADAVLER